MVNDARLDVHEILIVVMDLTPAGGNRICDDLCFGTDNRYADTPGSSKRLRSPDAVVHGKHWDAMTTEFERFCQWWQDQQTKQRAQWLQANLVGL